MREITDYATAKTKPICPVGGMAGTASPTKWREPGVRNKANFGMGCCTNKASLETGCCTNKANSQGPGFLPAADRAKGRLASLLAMTGNSGPFKWQDRHRGHSTCHPIGRDGDGGTRGGVRGAAGLSGVATGCRKRPVDGWDG